MNAILKDYQMVIIKVRLENRLVVEKLNQSPASVSDRLSVGFPASF